MEESYENTVTQGNMLLVKGHLFHKLDIVEDAGVQKNNHPGDDAVPGMMFLLITELLSAPNPHGIYSLLTPPSATEGV